MIALDRVSKTYPVARGGRRIVLDDISVALPEGCNIGILGGNGAGKSTLIRLLAGSELPDRGRIRRDVRVSFPLGYGGTFHGSLSRYSGANGRSQLRPNIALSGRENVAFLARVYGTSLREAIDYVTEFAELGVYFDMPVNTYSAGMRARLAFGACLAIDFDTYLIDEVTEIGDERFRRKCALAFRERMLRSDIILVTHNVRTIRQYCDRGAVLAGGELHLYDDVAAALDSYRRLYGPLQ
jgi:capsular polysaccharide transport system ATP-binding protein